MGHDRALLRRGFSFAITTDQSAHRKRFDVIAAKPDRVRFPWGTACSRPEKRFR